MLKVIFPGAIYELRIISIKGEKAFLNFNNINVSKAKKVNKSKCDD